MKRLFPGFLLVLMGIVVGGLSVFLIKSKTLPSQPSPTSSPVAIKTDPVAEKKKDLETFYKKIADAQDNRDWISFYDFIPKSTQNVITKDDFVKQQEKSPDNKFYSEKTEVLSITVEGDKGKVERTIITCLTLDCSGKNRIEDHRLKDFDFVQGKWQFPDPEPSERALKVVNYIYTDTNSVEKKSIVELFGKGTKSEEYSLRNWAVYLDSNLQEMIRLETLIEKSKVEQSRPIYNEQVAPVVQQAPSIQQKPMYCTSNTFGGSTFTNCY